MSCGLCLNDCPTYRVLGDEADSPRGRIQLIRVLMSSTAPPDPSAVAHLDACLVCRACETVCPSLVPFGRIMEGAREEVAARTARGGPLFLPGGPIARAVRAALIDLVTHPSLLAVATALATVYERSGLRGVARPLMPRRLRGMESLLAPREGPGYRPVDRGDADVQLFAGCVMRAAFGETQRATVRALEAAGAHVGAPADQVCCGALHAHAGMGDRARDLAQRNVRAFADTRGPIVVTAAGCGAHLKAYGHVIASGSVAEPRLHAEAERFAARVRDATEIVSPAEARRGLGRPVRVVYQDACHIAHGQGIRRQPRDLLRAIGGVELVPIADPERCCGSAGVYNLTHPQVAQELQEQKVRAILAARPDVVVSANPGCILQIRAGLREAGSDLPVVHVMRFVDDPAAALALDT